MMYFFSDLGFDRAAVTEYDTMHKFIYKAEYPTCVESYLDLKLYSPECNGHFCEDCWYKTLNEFYKYHNQTQIKLE